MEETPFGLPLTPYLAVGPIGPDLTPPAALARRQKRGV